jgi:hypothetical protein
MNFTMQKYNFKKSSKTNQNDETLPSFIKKKAPTTGEKKKQRARTKVQAGKRAPKSRQAKEPQRGEPNGSKGTTEIEEKPYI